MEGESCGWPDLTFNVQALIFSYLDVQFADVLCCVSSEWQSLAVDPCWKPDVLLYSWGDGDCSGHASDAFIPRPKLLQRFYSPQLQDKIISVACSDFVTLALSADGSVHQWGYEHGHNKHLLKPQRIDTLNHITAISVSCPGYYHARARSSDAYHAAALSDKGSFWMWGLNDHRQIFLDPHDAVKRSFPEPHAIDVFKNKHERVLRFSCGAKVTAVQTEDESGCTHVYYAGYLSTQPQEISALRSMPLTQLICGGFFGCAVDSKGRLWTWGSVCGPDRSNGNLLGHGRAHYRDHSTALATALPVQTIPNPVQFVAASSYNCAAVTDKGELFTWGDCDGGALGHHETSSHLPCRVQIPDGSSICHVSLAYTNGAVATQNGKLFMWGGRSWNNGISDRWSQSTGLPAQLEWNQVAKGYRCDHMVLGHNHAYILARKNVSGGCSEYKTAL